ncbi:hypothetical protein H4R18_005647 [Coemansia javaensis]|uniref:Major facilitator superfamily (MFS) profile domain-containing protein n=1 Tax=Coemansia javaensis TaxID=2761396 RepID=A0A9W8LCZ5_9FUNG|nr:hypothetical protein H4R18_005647 [Coemansia javaensis]
MSTVHTSDSHMALSKEPSTDRSVANQSGSTAAEKPPPVPGIPDAVLHVEECRPEPRWWENKPLEKPLDGFYGWMVVLSGFFMLMFSMGCTNSYGEYQTYYHLHLFPSEKMSTLSWIGTLQFAMANLAAPLAGILCERLETRLVAFSGGLVMGLSLVIASFCVDTPWKLIVTQGIVFGLGAALVFIPSVSIPSQWFNKHRPLAVGVAVSGSGIGGLWLTPATRAMIDNLGPGWALRITGIMLFAANTAVAPLMRNRIKVQSRTKVLDLSILREARFIFISVGSFCALAAYFTPLFSLPSFAVQVAGKSSSFGTNLLTIFNAASTVGRIATGQIAGSMGNINVLVVCTVLSSLSILVLWLPFQTGGTLIACAIVYGLVCGGVISLIPVIMANVWGVERISTTIGILYLANFAGTLVGAPSSGAILDNIGHRTNFRPTIVFSGVFMLCASAFFAALRFSMDWNPFARI